jgi:hypothetical protein
MGDIFWDCSGDAVRRRKTVSGRALRKFGNSKPPLAKIRGTAPIRKEILMDFPAKRR